jgi:hypothetical protein
MFFRKFCACLSAALLLIVPARALDVDFDSAIIILDDFLQASGVTTRLAGQDNDGNGLKEEDQLGMLSALLAGGSGVSCISSSRKTDITNGFNSNFTKVKQELIVNVSGAGTVDIINQLAGSNAQLGTALQNCLAGFLTVADTSTITFVNQLSDNLAAAYLTSINQSGQVSSVQNQINFLASDYQTYGNAPPGPNYLGPAGDIENDGLTNLSEYTVGAVPKGRELWLTDCCITAPLRLVTVEGGGLRVSGLPHTFAVTVAGGNANKTYSWRKGTTSSYTVVNTSSSYTITFPTTSSSGNYFCVINDGSTTRTTPYLTLSVTYVPLYIAQQPQGATKSSGASHTFSVVAQGGAGPGPYQYSWRKGTTVVGSNSPSYTISNLTTGNSGTYSVYVTSNGGGDALQSQSAVLTVNSAPFSITQQPQAQKKYVGDALNLSVTVSGGSGNFQYTWTRNGNTVGTTTNGNFAIASLTKSNAGTYRCTIRDLSTSSERNSDNAAIEVQDPLVITQHPQDDSVAVGQTFTMTVAATGGYTPLAYQWRWEGINIPSQTSATYSTTAYSGFGGEFTCLVTDANGRTAESAPATLTVDATVQILVDPIGGDFYVGESTSLLVSAEGTALGYEWRKNGVAVGAPSSATLTLNNLTAGNAGSYTVVVTKTSLAPAESQPAVVRVVTAPSISASPQSATLYEGEDHILSVSAINGYPPLEYQWRIGGSPINGATSATLNLINVDSGDEANYDCIVRDQRGTSLTSGTATIDVVAPLAISVPPSPGAAYTGNSISLAVGTTGGVSPLAFVWKQDGNVVANPGTATLSFPSAQLDDAGSYVCEITDARSTKVTTTAVLLEVADDLNIVQQPQSASVFAGEDRDLSFVVTGGFAPIDYVWRKDGNIVDGATQATLSLQDITVDNAGDYTCSVRDRFSHIRTSTTATISVADDLMVTIDPLEARRYVGQSLTVNTSVSNGNGPYTYTWRRDGSLFSAADSPTLQLNNLQTLSAGTYRCLVTNDFGAGALSDGCALDVRAALLVSAQPQDQTSSVGGTASFSVAATGGFPPLTYQWYFGDSLLPGETESTLTLGGLTQQVAGDYHCVISDAYTATVPSNPAQLEVLPALTFTEQPQPAARYVGDSVNFSVSAGGGVPPLTFTWYRDETPVGNDTSLQFATLSLSNAGSYYCIVEDANGISLTSEAAELRMAEVLQISQQPEGANLAEGAVVALTVAATGGFAPLDFQWYKGGELLPGANTATLSFNPAAQSNSGDYRCEISDDEGTTRTSDIASLAVFPRISATLPGNADLYVGDAFTLGAEVTGGVPPLGFAWWRGGEVAGNGLAVEFPAVSLGEAGEYTLKVTDGNGAESNLGSVTLNIADRITITGQSADTEVVAGEQASFSITATGGYPPLNFQWYKGEDKLNGAITSVFNLPAANNDDGGIYTCLVKDARGDTATTAPIKLTVIPNLIPVTQPTSITAYVGTAVSLTYEVGGGKAPINYAWYRGDILESEGSTIEFPSVTLAHAGDYRCVATAPSGESLTSEVATIEVGKRLGVLTQPVGGDRYVGESTTFTVVPDGGVGTIQYAWKRGAVPVGGDSATLAIPATALADAGTYTCTITDDLSSVTTDGAAVLIVAKPLQATAQLKTVTLRETQSLQANVIASLGFFPYTYQWFRNGSLVSTDATLSLSDLAVADSGTYTCMVSDRYRSAPEVEVLDLTVLPGLPPHSADLNADSVISLDELLRTIQFYGSLAYHCQAGTEDDYAPGPGDTNCRPYSADYAPQDWVISLDELLRVIQLYSSLGYYICPDENTEDGYCPGFPEGEGGA